MVTGQVRELQRTDPRRVRIVYERARWHEAWDNNPRIARNGERGDFQELRPRDGFRRPYIQNKTDERWTWKKYSPPRGELYFTEEEHLFGKQFEGRVIFEPRIKPSASPNKDWGLERWIRLSQLARKVGIRFTQLGENDRYRVDHSEFIATSTMRHAAAVIATARAMVLPEGGMHHVAAAFNRPAIVLFGGYISPEVTGYEGQRSIYTGGNGLGCGMRVRCAHCAEAMAAIKPERIIEELREIL